jgi:hypothetical protein
MPHSLRTCVPHRQRADPQPETTAKDPFVIKYDTDLHLRRLRDGSEHRVVSVMYEPGELQSLIEVEGWKAEILATRWFIFGSAVEPESYRSLSLARTALSKGAWLLVANCHGRAHSGEHESIGRYDPAYGRPPKSEQACFRGRINGWPGGDGCDGRPHLQGSRLLSS